MPIYTVETRWFRPGPLPESVLRWFSDLGSGAASDWETREDMYLVVPGSEEIGIKARSLVDAFEVKCRTSLIGERAFGPRLRGRMDSWAKWSVQDPLDENWMTAVTRRFPGAVRIWKSRLKRYYRFPLPGRPEEVRGSDVIERGGILEIARVRVGGAEHWSLAMEAFPTDPRLATDLAEAVAGLAGGFPIELGLEQAMAYPRWLSDIISL